MRLLTAEAWSGRESPLKTKAGDGDLQIVLGRRPQRVSLVEPLLGWGRGVRSPCTWTVRDCDGWLALCVPPMLISFQATPGRMHVPAVVCDHGSFPPRCACSWAPLWCLAPCDLCVGAESALQLMPRPCMLM